MRYITWTFALDITRQTIRNLWHDGSLFRWSTWQSAAKLLFAKDGMIRGNVQLWKAYQSPSFHPRQQDMSNATHWLENNQQRFTVVSRPVQAST